MCRSRRRARIGSMRIWSPSGSNTYRSGCARRETRSASPRSSPANASAARRFPTPRGPWKRYACAGPSTSAARRSRFASSCSGKVSKLSTDLLGDIFGVLRPVDHDHPLREEAGELPVGAVDLREEAAALALDTVELVLPAGDRPFHREREKEGSIWEEPGRRQEVELEHALDPESSRQALIGQRGVEIPLADDVVAPRESGADHLVDELGARAGEERGLS